MFEGALEGGPDPGAGVDVVLGAQSGEGIVEVGRDTDQQGFIFYLISEYITDLTPAFGLVGAAGGGVGWDVGSKSSKLCFPYRKTLARGFPLDPSGDEQGGEIMGRPKLGEAALRRHVVTVRLNDGEHEELRRQAGKARQRVPEFIRQRVLERRLQIGSPRQLGVAEFRELNRIGVNLNQIARALNQRSDVAAPRLDELRRLGELIAHLLER